MNKTELINRISERANCSKKQSEKAINAFTEIIKETLKSGDNVQLIGFGNFQVKIRPPREGRNPKTGEIIHIAAVNIPSFKAGKNFKKAVK